MSRAALSPRAAELSQRFFKSLGQTVKLVSLYKSGHPVPSSSLQEVWHLVHDLLVETGWPEACFSLVGGRWMVNDEVLADAAHSYELLAIVFRSHALQSVTFLPEIKLFELSAFCEMAATPPNQAYQTDAEDFLKERGVRHVRVNLEQFVRARKVRPHASPMISNPLARLKPAPVEGASASMPAATQGFGQFIKNLVEQAVPEPGERAKVYAEALRLVEQALARHVSEATHRLLLEKQGVVNERVRAEHVLGKVAEGKVVVDQEGRVLMMDPAAEGIAGRPFREVAGKPLLESLGAGGELVSLAEDLVLPENRPVSEGVRLAGPVEVLSALRQSLALVHDEQGRLVGTYAVLPHEAKYRETLRMQEEFVASVTHDLKGPLASISSALELVADKLGSRLSAREAEFLDIGLRNARQLRQMIDEILDFSKLASGRMSVKPAPGPLAPMLREAVEALTPWARSKGLDLVLADHEGLEALPSVLADPRRVVQVLNNLISNAIKFTPQGGRIEVEARLGEGDRTGKVEVSVRDTGCGIAVPDQKRIFERFVQGSNGARGDGVGLGLAIAKELVGQHHGEIWLESVPGDGSTFFFTLPLAGVGP